MNSPVLRIERSGEPAPVVLATVELDRRAGVLSDASLGLVDLVDHVTAWVLDDGAVLAVLAVVTRRSAVRSGHVVAEREIVPPTQASLSATERYDVLHAAGLRRKPSLRREQARWEVA